MSPIPVTEAELHAYIDGELPEARRSEVDQYLEHHPEDAARLASYRAQNAALRLLFDPVLDEPVPRRLLRRPRTLLRHAAVVAWVALGAVIGWAAHDYGDRDLRGDVPTWAKRAAVAHVVYSPEVRHPVEVAADQEAHLVTWLSKRLGADLKVPHLSALGYGLVGGRLLPGDKGPVAQFMYQDGKGQRLTLYIRTNAEDNRETAFRYARDNNVGVFYWLDRKLGYALSGEMDKEELLRVATAVYRQLNP
ncbi:MAG: anti-sigma factor family protein [Rhodospirillaceae bacterium]